MGTWGTEPWDSDDAADWLSGAFKGMDIDAALDDAFKYYDMWGKIRSACYLLATLGRSSYLWPGDLDRLDGHIATGLKLLEEMADPEGEFLTLGWSESSLEELTESLAREIAALRALTTP